MVSGVASSRNANHTNAYVPAICSLRLRNALVVCPCSQNVRGRITYVDYSPDRPLRKDLPAPFNGNVDLLGSVEVVAVGIFEVAAAVVRSESTQEADVFGTAPLFAALRRRGGG